MSEPTPPSTIRASALTLLRQWPVWIVVGTVFVLTFWWHSGSDAGKAQVVLTQTDHPPTFELNFNGVIGSVSSTRVVTSDGLTTLYPTLSIGAKALHIYFVPGTYHLQSIEIPSSKKWTGADLRKGLTPGPGVVLSCIDNGCVVTVPPAHGNLAFALPAELLPTRSFNPFWPLVWSLLTLIALVAGVLLRRRYADREFPLAWAVAGLGAVIGIAYATTLPPYQGADESQHFLRMQQIARGTIFAIPEGRDLGVLMTKTERDVVASFSNLPFHPDVHTSWATIREKGAIEIPDETPQYYPCTAGGYSPISYLTYIPGYWLARIFTRSPIWLTYAARIGSVLIYSTLMGLLLTALPIGKMFAATLILWPMALAQSAVISADVSPLLGIMALLVAIYRIHATGDRSRRTLGILAAAIILLTLGKLVYILGTGLLASLVLDRSAVAASPRRRLAIVGISWSAALILLWTWFHFNNSAAAPPDAATMANRPSLVFGDPRLVVGVLQKTSVVLGDVYWSTFVARFGWLDTLPPPRTFYLALGLLVVAIVQDRRLVAREDAFGTLRVMAAILAFAMIIAIEGVMFVTFGYDGGVINGVQGRYFVPAVFTLLAFVGGGAKPTWSRAFLPFVGIIYFHWLCLTAIVTRYYG